MRVRGEGEEAKKDHENQQKLAGPRDAIPSLAAAARGRRGPSLPFTFCLHPSTFTSQLGSPRDTPLRRSEGARTRDTDHLCGTGHKKVLASSASSPSRQRKRPMKTGVEVSPTSGSKAPGSPTGDETWGRRAAPTLPGRGRWPPPHPTSGPPLTRTAAGESAGKLGAPHPIPRLADLALPR